MNDEIEEEFSKSQINKAGIKLTTEVSKEEQENTLKIINFWRRKHSYPLLIFYKTLKRKSTKIDPKAICVQRLKRIPSIVKKLKRKYPHSKGGIKITRMQDIAGCRAILKNINKLNELYKKEYSKFKLQHKQIKVNNYILEPKEDGYRGIHLIYEYKSDKEKKEFNKLLVEIQLRTKLQHIWATAVETTSFFTGQALKSAEGEEEWFEFFRLVSSAFAIKEKMPQIANTPRDKNKLIKLIKQKEKKLKIITRMKQWNESLRIFDDLKTNAQKEFFILELDTIQDKITITSFDKKEEEKANKLLNKIEKRIYGIKEYDVVLVGAKNFQELKKGYPNYFADTKEFIKEINKMMCGR